MRYKLAGAFLLGSACIPLTPAAARCNLSMDAPGRVQFQGGGGTGYESFARARYEAEFSVAISNEGSETCSGLITVGRLDSRDGLRGSTGVDLNYSVTLPGNVSTLTENQAEGGRPQNAIPVTILPGQTQVQRLTFQIPPRQVIPSGTYDGTVQVRILDAADLEVSTERSVQLATTVRSAMSIMLYDTGISSASLTSAGTQNHRMDFQALEAGEQGSVTLLVQSNDDYILRFHSPHGGALWHTVYGAAEKIGYTATFGGQELNLASGEALVNGAGATDLAGVSQPLNIRIGQIGTARSGRYEDDITITVLPAG